MVVVRGVTTSCGRVLDFEVAAGELLVLAGGPASGKTTLLRALAAEAAPSRGAIAIDGFDTQRERERVRARVGLVAPAHAAPAEGAREVRLALLARAEQVAVPRAVAERRSAYLSALFEVRGPGWRLDLACALIHEPRVVLFDEPPPEAWPYIERLREESQLAIIVTSRDAPADVRVVDLGDASATAWQEPPRLRRSRASM